MTTQQERSSAHRAFLAWSHHVMRRGLHPLSIGLRPLQIRLHPDAAKPMPGEPGLRCGDCIYRRRHAMPGGARRTKCAIPGRATTNQATDLRPWWPACTSHQQAKR